LPTQPYNAISAPSFERLPESFDEDALEPWNWGFALNLETWLEITG